MSVSIGVQVASGRAAGRLAVVASRGFLVALVAIDDSRSGG
jgi:hypothetical protein